MNQNNLWITHKQMILILIVVDNGLVRKDMVWFQYQKVVLILIVVEDGLVH